MSEPIVLRVYEVVGSSLCVSSEDGQKVYDQIAQGLRDDKHVRLSFQNIESLTSAFLNPAVGQLYGVFPEQELKESLSVQDMEKEDVGLLKRVIDTAKQYFQDPSVIKAARRDVMEDDDE